MSFVVRELTACVPGAVAVLELDDHQQTVEVGPGHLAEAVDTGARQA